MRLHTRQILFLIILTAIIVRLCIVVVVLSGTIHLIFIMILQNSPLQISDSTAPYLNVFGFEVSNVAYALVCKGEGLANPFGGDTGPTGWAAPGMVMLYVLAFKLFRVLFDRVNPVYVCLSAVFIRRNYYNGISRLHVPF